MTTLRYYSKKDSWLLALIGAVLLLPLALAIYDLFQGDIDGLSSLFFGIAVPGTLLLLTYPLYYDLTPTALEVRGGILVNQQIPLSAVQEVVPTRNPLSAPAWSLDRLRVNYETEDGESFMLISPTDKTGFMAELTRRDGGLELQDQRVVRVDWRGD